MQISQWRRTNYLLFGEETIPKVMREYCDAMVKKDLAKIAAQLNLWEYHLTTSVSSRWNKLIEIEQLSKNGKVIVKRQLRSLKVYFLQKSDHS